MCSEQSTGLKVSCVLSLWPGKALVDVLVLCGAPPPPSLRDLLPLMGALKHMGCWHSAKITLVTLHADG